MKEYRDASNRLSIDLSNSDTDSLFKKFADQIITEFNAKVTEKLDGLDQRYWDFDVDGSTLVLFADPMVGISIHIEDGTNDNLLRKIAKTLLTNEKTS
jgi:hypothetical protein